MLNLLFIDFTLVGKVLYFLVHKSWGVSSLCGCEKEVSLWGRNRREGGGVSRRPPPPVSPSLLSPSPSKGKGESISPAGPPQAPPPKPSSPKVFLSGPLLPSERGGGGGMGRPSFPPPFLGLGLYGNPPPRLESAGQRPVFGRRVRAGGLLLLSSHSLAPSVRLLVGPPREEEGFSCVSLWDFFGGSFFLFFIRLPSPR